MHISAQALAEFLAGELTSRFVNTGSSLRPFRRHFHGSDRTSDACKEPCKIGRRPFSNGHANLPNANK
jgi:hypothetical protein